MVIIDDFTTSNDNYFEDKNGNILEFTRNQSSNIDTDLMRQTHPIINENNVYQAQKAQLNNNKQRII